MLANPVASSPASGSPCADSSCVACAPHVSTRVHSTANGITCGPLAPLQHLAASPPLCMHVRKQCEEQQARSRDQVASLAAVEHGSNTAVHAIYGSKLAEHNATQTLFYYLFSLECAVYQVLAHLLRWLPLPCTGR